MRLLSKVLQTPSSPKTRHYIGFPPGIVSDEDSRKLLEPADILLIEERDEGFFLFRFTASGKEVGDTWHANLEDAKHQADFEFEGLTSSWIEVPDDVEDVLKFGLQ
jgi:hypothetical protein